MSNSCAQWRGDIGAYIVGALDEAAHDRIARHIAACPGCRADYDELVPVRDLLGMLAFTAGSMDPYSAGEFAELPADVPPGIRSRGRRLLIGVGAALAAAAAAVSVLVSSGAPTRTFGAADSATRVSAHAQLHDTPTGSQIDLTATGLRPKERCILVAVSHSGIDIAGSWDATYDGSAEITGTSAFHANQLIALRIESGTGNLLLSIRV